MSKKIYKFSKRSWKCFVTGFVLAWILAGGCCAAFAGVPVKFTVETSRADVQEVQCYHGETLDFDVTFKNYGKDLYFPTNAEAQIFWQTNGMSAFYWRTNNVNVVSNRMMATFLPEMDPGAGTVFGFIGIPGDIYRASFVLRLKQSPGWKVREMEWPYRELDFNQVQVVHAPYYKKQEVDGSLNALRTELEDKIASATPGAYEVVSNRAMHAILETDGTIVKWSRANTGSYNALNVGTRSPVGQVGAHSFAQGNNVGASGAYAHAQGVDTIASGTQSHAEGQGTIASGLSSHAEGSSTRATGPSSHAEGSETESRGTASHAEGEGAIAIGDFAHAEGYQTEASGKWSHAGGWKSKATSPGSFAQGTEAEATAAYAIAFGERTKASGEQSVAMGDNSQATAHGAVAAGTYTKANGKSSVAIGRDAKATGEYSLAGGCNSEAKGMGSIAFGRAQTKEDDKMSVAWSGATNTSGNAYQSHGPGTFNLNPIGGTKGFWIGEKNLEQIASEIGGSNSLELVNGEVKTKDGQTVGAAQIGALGANSSAILKTYDVDFFGVVYKNGELRSSFAGIDVSIIQGGIAFNGIDYDNKQISVNQSSGIWTINREGERQVTAQWPKTSGVIVTTGDIEKEKAKPHVAIINDELHIITITEVRD